MRTEGAPVGVKRRLMPICRHSWHPVLILIARHLGKRPPAVHELTSSPSSPSVGSSLSDGRVGATKQPCGHVALRVRERGPPRREPGGAGLLALGRAVD